jgi:arylsulfatase A
MHNTWRMTVLIAALALGASAAERPNFLVMLCDDLGYGDVGCFGSPTIATPHLDRLAAQGMKLTDCYASAPVCSPSRAGLLTGRTPNRLGIYDWIPGGHAMHMKKEERTIATLLRGAGYATCHSGKWHCNGKFNSPAQPQPGDHGFDHWFSTQNNAAPSHANPRNFVRNGRNAGQQKGYACQIVADEASRWLKARDANKPFFLFVCFHEPHEPIASPPDMVAKYPDAKKRGEALYYANVSNMDRAVGSLMKTLDDLKLVENTLVFFTSDNGPETLNRYGGAWRSHGSPGPLRGMKLHIYDGGIRVPGILRWPGHTKPGQVVDTPVSAVDLLPTFCELAGAAPPTDRALDGASLLPLFSGKPIKRTKPLFWDYYRAFGSSKVAIRDGDWKMVAHWDGPKLSPGASFRGNDIKIIKEAKLVNFELYNLRGDRGEKRDLAKDEPARLKAMSKTLVALYEEVQREGPAWDTKRKPRKKK